MGAVTNPDFCVDAALHEFFVPLQLKVDEAKEMAIKFRVMWRPAKATSFIMRKDGRRSSAIIRKAVGASDPASSRCGFVKPTD